MSPKRLLILLILSALVRTAPAQHDSRIDENLTALLESRIENFGGDVGIYVRHLTTGATAAINADSLFPTASMIKVPILVTLFDQIEKGNLSLDQKLVYSDSLLYPGEDILGSFRDGQEISLDKVALLMITTSDNTASLWLQELVGTGVEINNWLNRHKFEATRMNSRTPGRRPNWEQYGWGQTSPKEMADLLIMIRNGKAVSPWASEQMYRMLTRIYWNEEALSQIPPYVQAASKQGAVNASRSEVVLVNAPGGDYVFCVITKGQADQRWEDDNEGFVLIRTISRTLWQYFEPGSRWRPESKTR